MLALLLVCALLGPAAAGSMAQYDVVWNELEPESKQFFTNSMPIGNGGLGANVIGENLRNGTVSLLVAHTGAWSEAGEMIKVAFVDVHFDPNPFSSGSFLEMRMDVSRATVVLLLGGASSSTYSLKVEIYADATVDLIVLDAFSRTGEAYTATATVRVVRPTPTTVTPVIGCDSYAVSADVVHPRSLLPANTVCAYHRNAKTNYVNQTLQDLNLLPALPVVIDRIFNRTAAIMLAGPQFSSTADDTLVGRAEGGAVHLVMAVDSDVAPTLQSFVVATATRALKGSPDRGAHDDWWELFWDRSYIELSEFIVSRQYALQRMIVGMQARTPFPVKFNGMLFTAQREPAVDFRDWGGLNWWQNLRSPYYSLLNAGDEDLLQTMIESFMLQVPLARARTQIYYNHSGIFLPEYTHPLIGTTHTGAYGCGRAGKTDPPIWYNEDRWNHYNLQGALDLSLFILDHFSHTDDAAALSRYLPLIDGITEFYSYRWPENDANGKMVMFPSQAVETWQCPNYPPDPANCVTNDAPTISGLLAVLPRLLALPTAFATDAQRQAWAALLARVPDLPRGTVKGTDVLRPCEKCPPSTSNVENPEMYSTHPYRLFGVGRDELDLARATFDHILFPADDGWCQVAMDAALLGLADRAQAYVTVRAHTPPAPGYRFPVFMPHLQDYEPSADHLGIFAGALTYMLVQELDDVNSTVLLLPAWPCSWDVNFRIHVLRQTIIEGNLTGGQLTYTATPPDRITLIAYACQPVAPARADALADSYKKSLAVAAARPRNCKLGECV